MIREIRLVNSMLCIHVEEQLGPANAIAFACRTEVSDRRTHALAIWNMRHGFRAANR